MKQKAVTAFRNNELLRHLGCATIEKIAGTAIQRSYSCGTTIFSEGEKADAVFGVISGQVQITAHNAESQEIILPQVEPGGVFGLNSIIDGSPRGASARAASRAYVFILSREHFLNLLTRVPEFALQLIELLCRRQRIAERLIVEEYSASKVAIRLAHRLLEMGRTNGNGSANGPLAITQSDLAKTVFFSRQAVNRCLQDWQWRGIITATRGQLVIRDRDALQAIAKQSSMRSDDFAFRLPGGAVTVNGENSGTAAGSVRF